jgi:hypothetical protein
LNDFVFDHCLRQAGRDCIIDCFFENNCATNTLINDPSWDFAFSKSWNVHLGANARICRIQGWLQVSKRHLDRDLDAGWGNILYGALHGSPIY